MLLKYPRKLGFSGNKVLNNRFVLGSLTKDSFVPSPAFESALISVLHKHIHDDPYWKAKAQYQNLGFMNIDDSRAMGVQGRVNDPADILGVVLLKDGDIVPGSFEQMPTHNIWSQQGGLVQLTDYLFNKLPTNE